MKSFGINLTNYVQDLDEENYKTLMNEIKEELIIREIFRLMDKKTQFQRRSRGWRSRRTWSSPLPTNASRIHLQMEQFSQSTG